MVLVRDNLVAGSWCHHARAEPGRFRGDIEAGSAWFTGGRGEHGGLRIDCRAVHQVRFGSTQLEASRVEKVLSRADSWFESWCRCPQRRWSIYMWTIATCQKDFVSILRHNCGEAKSQPTLVMRCPPLRIHHIKTLSVGPSSTMVMRWWLDALVGSKDPASYTAEIVIDVDRGAFDYHAPSAGK